MISKIWAMSIGARPMDGSSSSSRRGRAIRARPMASICCSPPDIDPPVWVRRSASRGNSSKTRSRSCWNAADLRSLRAYAPMSRFSSTVIPGKMPRPSGDWQIPIVVRW